MAMRKGRRHYLEAKGERPKSAPTRQGIYRRCWRGLIPCSGFVTVNGVRMTHRACGGDGYRRVGTTGGNGPAPRGRRRRRPPRSWTARKLAWRKGRKRAGRNAAVAGGVVAVAGVVWGTVGVVVVAALLVLTFGLAVRSRMAGVR